MELTPSQKKTVRHIIEEKTSWWNEPWVYAQANSDSPTLSSGDPGRANPDYYYESDKNVLYRIKKNLVVKYDTFAPGQIITAAGDLPEGYNMLVTFADGKVRIVRDGVEVDVYGDGIYDENSLWHVPGYENFPAGPSVDKVTVEMVIRETPMQYLRGTYDSGDTYENNQMYWLAKSMANSRAFYLGAALTVSLGLALLAAWLILRRDRQAADVKIASWTAHVWTELRFLALALSVAALLLGDRRILSNVWYELFYGGYVFTDYVLRSLIGGLENTPALLALVWTCWLVHNDHRHTPKAQRRSLWRLVAARSRTYPFQKRAAWRSRCVLVLVCLPVLGALALAISMGYQPLDDTFWVMMLTPCLAAVGVVFHLRRSAALTQDVGRLADQIHAIREGDLTTPLTLPRDADLQETAEKLTDIQSGMHKALVAQTHSERMKVELISNVSHDLKTPLTSILSYAELLRQEDLSPVAMDYARIIDEKAQRLNAMVQDVFEVSKATASQLPVQPERLDLGKLLRQTLADMADPIQASALTFKIELPEAPVEIVADGKRLYRVFQNLIQNALQYALAGSRVYLTLTAREGRAEAKVRNTSHTELPSGVDFTARFVRGDESRTDGGSGLGLSIASSFTEACGGTFHVETVADLFTAVVTFPLAETETI